MKPIYRLLFCFLIISSCKNLEKQDEPNTVEHELTTAQKIANAHGFEHWKNVEKVKFTFKVDRDTIKGDGRSWEWYPKKDSVVMQAGEQKVSYLRSELDSVPKNADKAFVNDKYWFFVPFQLVWDSDATISNPKKAEAPISKSELNKITITYPDNSGGYTPGDAYDIFYNDNFLLEEWIFRKGNSEEPTMATTFENYKDYNGIKIATDHKMAGGNWNLNFSDVEIEMQ